MAQFINEREEEQTNEFFEEPVEEQEETPEETAEEVEQPEPEVDDIPDKYRGKTTKEIIAMHQNAESMIGKQGQEVGELRKIVDDFISSQTVEKQAQAVLQDFSEEDFFDNPKKAIEQFLSNHPALKQSQEVSQELKKQTALASIKNAHPDYTSIISDKAFLEWVGNSKVRTRLLSEANDNYDFDSANELFSLWKERQAVANDALEVEKKQRKEQVKSASSGTSKGSGEPRPRKIYRRADIIELMRKDPSRYRELAADIRRAYAEGRVK